MPGKRQQDFHWAIRGGSLAAMADFAGRQLLAVLEEDPPNDKRVAEAQAFLRDVLPEAPAESWSPLGYIESQTWTTSKSGDHQYVLIRNSTDWRTHLVLIRWLRAWGTRERFAGSWYRYIDVEGYHYWAMTSPNDTIANRRRLTDETTQLQLNAPAINRRKP
jgi:hypothetical protein